MGLLGSSTGFSWVGFQSYSGVPSTITSGFSGTAATHIVYIELNHDVDIRTASVDTISIHNGDIITHAGNVTLIW